MPCCQDEPRGGSLHPAGLGCHRGARLRLGRSRGQLVRVLFLWYFEFPTPCLGKQKPSGGSSDHTHDNCCLQLCSSWQFGKNADIWKWKWTKWTSQWVNVRERCCLLRLSPGVHLWWWTVCRHQHDTDNTRARFEILIELRILIDISDCIIGEIRNPTNPNPINPAPVDPGNAGKAHLQKFQNKY